VYSSHNALMDEALRDSAHEPCWREPTKTPQPRAAPSGTTVTERDVRKFLGFFWQLSEAVTETYSESSRIGNRGSLTLHLQRVKRLVWPCRLHSTAAAAPHMPAAGAWPHCHAPRAPCQCPLAQQCPSALSPRLKPPSTPRHQCLQMICGPP
jgi:hypothetical protein